MKDQPNYLYIGEWHSNEGITPCPQIEYGMGQCGECAQKKKTMIAVDTRELENYIACDDHTLSEIVIPVLNKDGSYRTQLDIDSPEVATFNTHDELHLKAILRLMYPDSPNL